MHLGVLKETTDARVALTPDSVSRLISDNHDIQIETGAGATAFFSDTAYEAAGATIRSRTEILKSAEALLCVRPPSLDEMKALAPGTVVMGMFNPHIETDLAGELKQVKILPFTMELIPRTTIAQAMDVLSSMASLAGYKAVIMAADYLPSYFPMLVTAAGTIPPARVLVLGAGVAGLQAIATARRLGAIVEAFDVRAAAKEEVESLGAKFVEVPGAKDDAAAGGYAVEQTEEYLRKQKELIQATAARAQVVITTANVPGRRAPLLVEEATVNAMQPGSVIIDLAAESGGNCAFTKNGETVHHNGVAIIGESNLAARMPRDASRLYSTNMLNFFRHVCKNGKENIDFTNDIVSATYLGSPL